MALKIKQKFLKIVGLIGPGLFLIGYNIGTGSVTTMAKAGAEYGMTLFWAVVLSCIFTYILMVAYGQLTLVSGKTALFNIKTELKGGKLLAIYILVALITGELLALVGIMGILADLVQEAIKIFANGVLVNRFWIITLFTILLYLLLWFGRYSTFEKVLTILVTIMALCFFLVFILVKPSLSSILNGMIPGIPKTPGSFALVAAIAGTTCSAAVFIMRSTVLKEKGWTVKDLKNEKNDSFVAAAMMLFLSGIIMAVSAGTLHEMGLKLNNTTDMISLFQPLGGKLAVILLVTGILGAGLSTVFPIVLIAPWLISDYTGKPGNIKSPMYRSLILFGLLFAFGSIFIRHTSPIIMIFSQAFQACILPAVAIPVFILLNQKKIKKNYRQSDLMNFGLILVIIFAFITTYFAISDFFQS